VLNCLYAVPSDCQEEVLQYYVRRSKNINKNVPLGEYTFNERLKE